MKTVLWMISSLCVPFFLYGRGDEAHNHSSHAVAAESTQQMYSGSGKVKSIADDHMSLRIFHDPIPELKWPAMNMKFDVVDHDLTHPLEVGDTIRFEFYQKDGKQIITKIAK